MYDFVACKKAANFSDKHRTEFLYFVFNLSIVNGNFKNLVNPVNRHVLIGLVAT